MGYNMFLILQLHGFQLEVLSLIESIVLLIVRHVLVLFKWASAASKRPTSCLHFASDYCYFALAGVPVEQWAHYSRSHFD
jgi:hypothetical protein